MLIDRFNREKFKNQAVADAVETLLKLEPQFQMAARSNDAFGGILITLMQSFRDEAQAIADLIGAPTPKPKITQPVVFVDRHKATALTSGELECPGCVKSGKTISSATEIPAKKTSEIVENSNPTNIREVLNMFSSDIEQMRRFAKINGIGYQANTTAEGLAKKILNYFTESGE